MAGLTSKMSQLNPFSKSKGDDEDKGEEIQNDSVSGGGHHSTEAFTHKSELRISPALRSYLAKNGAISHADAGLDSDRLSPALKTLLGKPHCAIPSALLDRSHPLPEYFISSSHNTYLIAHQLYGTSSASAYETALKTGSRCVEIDAWDNDEDEDEPKVTHGYTLVSNVPFRLVCETIRRCLDEELAEASQTQNPANAASPIFISLENHCGAHGQQRLALIMREVFGDRLVSKAVREEGREEQKETGEHVSLHELGARIALIVEYHLPDEKKDDDDDSSSSSSSDDEKEAANQNEEKAARQAYKAKKQAQPSGAIVAELAELGVYAQSVKPSDNSWFDSPAGQLKSGPHHHLINVSESGLAAHLPAQAAHIAHHNSQHLMRVYPKGTRISSGNLKPVAYWAIGAQICALNWQTFGTANQLNAALFDGSEGYVLKPPALRSGGNGTLVNPNCKKRLRFHVAGATDIPVHEDDGGSKDGADKNGIKPYVSCTLYHPSNVASADPPKRKTKPYKHHKLELVHKGDVDNPPSTDPVWDEVLEWEYEESELVFLRVLIKHDESWSRNPMMAVAAVRLDYVAEGWTFISMLDMKGRRTKCTLLARFEISDV